MTERASPEPEHARRRDAFAAEAARQSALADRISFLRLALFFVLGSAFAAAFSERSSILDHSLHRP